MRLDLLDCLESGGPADGYVTLPYRRCSPWRLKQPGKALRIDGYFDDTGRLARQSDVKPLSGCNPCLCKRVEVIRTDRRPTKVARRLDKAWARSQCRTAGKVEEIVCGSEQRLNGCDVRAEDCPIPLTPFCAALLDEGSDGVAPMLLEGGIVPNRW
ncbi:MAG: hypothetical protein HY331_01580 [Chloroflexi bacterium]|nr:hypothetical protein [Chloroflexota bacterium]